MKKLIVILLLCFCRSALADIEIAGLEVSGLEVRGTAGASASGPLLVLTVGDSITRGSQGSGNPVNYGYRGLLQSYLGNGVYDFVGPYSDPSSGVYDRNHGGLGGDTTTGIKNRLNAYLNSYFTEPANSNSMVIIMAGTNDIRLGGGSPSVESAAVTNVQSMVNAVFVKDVNIRIYVCTIIPNVSSTITGYNVSYNSALSTMITSFKSSNPTANVTLIDTYAAFVNPANCNGDYNNCLKDGLHPNDEFGYPLIAETIYAAVGH